MAWAEDRGGFAINAAVSERMGFIRRTYAHLAGEIAAVGLVCWLTLNTPALYKLAFALGQSLMIYILVFFGVSLVSRKLMQGNRSMGVQYAGAGLWVVFLGFLVAPLALMVHALTGSYAILGQGFVLTGCIFAGLTAYVFFTKKDFAFMGAALSMVSMLLFGASILGFFFGLGGIGWSVLWVVLLAGWVLYDTSRILHHRHVSQHVAASVDLLVDFVYMFIHVVMLLLGAGRD